MQPRWRLTALSLSLAFSPASVAAQTHYVTGAPTVVSAGAFATTVVFEGGEIFVGRPGEFAFFPIPANHAGTVHVFGLDDMGNWEETAVLSSESVEVGDGFGMSLAVHGNTLLAGAPKTRGGRGAVYVFTRSDADAPWRAVTTEWHQARRGRIRRCSRDRWGVRSDQGHPGECETRAPSLFSGCSGMDCRGLRDLADDRWESGVRQVRSLQYVVRAAGLSPKRRGRTKRRGAARRSSVRHSNENSGVVHHFNRRLRLGQGAQITAATAAPGSGFATVAPRSGAAQYGLRDLAGWRFGSALTVDGNRLLGWWPGRFPGTLPATPSAYAVGSSAGGEDLRRWAPHYRHP